MSGNITFHDNKGRRIKLPEKTTLDELLRLGFTDYHLAKPHEPLPDEWWRAEKPKKKEKKEKQ